MPTVNTYGPRRVLTAALPGARLSSAETLESTGADYQGSLAQAAQQMGRAKQVTALAGARVAEEVQGLTGVALRHQIDERNKAVEAAHQVTQMEAQNKLSLAVNDLVNNPESGALQVKGKDVLGLPEYVRANYDRVAGDIEAALPTAEDKVAFRNYQLHTGINVDTQIMRHTAGELQRYEGQELQSTVVNSRNDAIVAASDPRAIADLPRLAAQSIDRATTAIKQSGPRLGMTPEQVKEQVLAAQSDTHTGIVNQLLATNQVGAARAWFAEAKDDKQLTGAQQTSLQKAIDEGSTRMQAQKISDEIIAGGGTMKEQLAKARNLTDAQDPTGAVRDQVEQRIEHEAAQNERQERVQLEATLNDAWNIVEKTGSYEAVPPSMRAQLGPHLPSLRAEALRIAKGEPRETDEPTFYGLFEMARTNPTEFIKQNLLAYKGNLSKSDFQQLTQLRMSISNGEKASAAKQLEGFATHKEIVDSTLVRWGMDPNAKYDTDQGKANATLMGLLDRAVTAAQEKAGKKLDNIETQKILNNIMTTQSESKQGSWWGLIPFNGISLRDQPGKGILSMTIDDVPTKDRADIEQRMKQRGLTVSPELVLDVWKTSQVTK